MRAIFPAAGVSLVIAACGLFSPGRTVIVHLPEPPPHWQAAFASISARVLYVDAGGHAAEATVADWEEPGRIECSKAQNSPVLAFPRVRSGAPGGAVVELPPAGGLFPMSLAEDGDTLVLAWGDGCAALTLWKAWSQGVDLSAFDAARLAAEMREAADPWTWDSTAIAEAIVGGGFTFYDIDPLACLDVRVCPGPGQWLLESPFAVPAAVAAGEALLLPGVPAGMHTLFSTGRVRIRIFVDGERAMAGPPEQW